MNAREKVKIGVQKTLAAKQADKSKLKKLGYTKRHIYAKSKWMGPNKFFFWYFDGKWNNYSVFNTEMYTSLKIRNFFMSLNMA